MSLFESAAAVLLARARRDNDALIPLTCASTRQRIVILRDSLDLGELWQWQQEESATEGYDDTQLVIEQLFSQPLAQISKMLSPATFQIVGGTTRRARLRFAIRKRQNPMGDRKHSVAYAYYIIMERETDGIWRYFNTNIEQYDANDDSNNDGVVKSPESGVWFSSIGMAEDAARHGGKPYGQPDIYVNNEMVDEDAEDDNYWAMYDSNTPAKGTSLSQTNNNNAEDDYWSRYDVIDSQTPPPRKNNTKTTQPNMHKQATANNNNNNINNNSNHSASRQLSSIGEPRDVLLQNLRVLRHMANQMGITREEFIEMAHQA
ncbi:hypothetical protein BDF22DRAFT_665636 [Syncephalis plumigaleata]|nr:hypothetical protein BDF22DRAFT_665636 [Syncephalis plumigaleata]